MASNNALPGAGARLRRREPLTDTDLLLRITISIFFGMYILAMVIFGGGFLRPQQLFDTFNNNASLIIISCGLTVVMIAGGIDISVGGVIGLTTMSCGVFLNSASGSVLGSLGLAIAIGLGIGLLQGYLVAYLQIQPFIITLAGMFMTRGLTTIINAQPVTVSEPGFKSIVMARLEIPWLGYEGKAGWVNATVEPGVIVALFVVLVVFFVLRWTRLGRNLYAIGGNSQSAITLGINVKRTRFYSHVISGLLAGIAGYVYIMHTGAASATGDANMFEMKAIASSIIGGTLLTGGVGNVIGTLFGALTLMTITSVVISSGLREPWWQSITTGAMLMVFIVLQSIVLSRRGKGFKFAVPQWLKFGKERSVIPEQQEQQKPLTPQKPPTDVLEIERKD